METKVTLSAYGPRLAWLVAVATVIFGAFYDFDAFVTCNRWLFALSIFPVVLYFTARMRREEAWFLGPIDQSTHVDIRVLSDVLAALALIIFVYYLFRW